MIKTNEHSLPIPTSNPDNRTGPFDSEYQIWSVGGGNPTVCHSQQGSKNGAHGVTERFGLSAHMWGRHLWETAAADLGAEVFEFAIIVPVLFSLLIGIVWIGRAYNVYETITRAAREGARYAVLPNSVADGNLFPDPLKSSCSTGTNTFNNYVAPALQSDNLNPNAVKDYCQVTQWLENTDPRQCGVSISFSYPVQMAIPFTSLNMTTFNIRTQAQMRLENQPIENQPTGGRTCP